METRRLRLLEKTRRIGTWTVDIKQSLCTWSHATYDIHEEDYRKTIRLEDGIQYYIPEHQPIIQRCVQAGIEERKPWDVELQIRTARGRTRWVRAIGEPIFADDTVVQLHGIFEDIHQRKSLEVEREDLLTRMLEGERIAKLGYWKWTIEPERMEWSPGLYRIYEIAPDQAPLSVEQQLSMIHEDDRETYRTTIMGAVQRKEPYSIDMRVIVDGHEKAIRSEGFPKLDAQGALKSLVGIAIDLTELTRSKTEIENLNRRLTLALEASKIGVWEWNLQSDTLIWDRRMYSLYGVSPDQFSGAYSAWEAGLHPDDKEQAVANLSQSIRDRGSFEHDFRVVWPSTGEVRTIRAVANLHTDAEQRPATMIGANWDVTESEKNKRELERSNTELAQLAYRTSHDLKAPLTTIKGLARYVAQDLRNGQLEEAIKNTEVIGRQAASLEGLVVGILEAAKADLAKTPVEEVDLASLVSEVVEGHRAQCEQHGVIVEQQVEAARAYLLPRSRVFQVLTNLVSNSIKYADPNKPERFVRISMTERHEQITLQVEDNGLGIPAEYHDQVFDMFRTCHSGKIAGSGIGLYIVKKHVEQLNGTIQVASTSEGTRFRVEFYAKAA